MHTLYGETMGTRWRVDLCAARDAALDRLHGAIQSRLDMLDAQMSTWRPASDLMRYNRAPAGSWHHLPDDLFLVMREALAIAAASGGAFDPALGEHVGAWGFGAQAAARAPDASPPAPRMPPGQWRRLRLREDTRQLLQPGGVALDLSAIAKGHGVDAVIEVLRGHDTDAALVDVGGELRAMGRKPDGSGWRVLVETGDEDDDAPPCVLGLDDLAVATSGPRWHHYLLDGRLLSHTIDPRTGAPVDAPLRAVTVVAPTAIAADAWATALTVMGLAPGLTFARAHGLAARFVPHAPGEEAIATDAFLARVASR